ncbi:MAG: gfo/Idh/MocA family oxidoreductase, partial [Pontibacter sp.]|nr:gfo/Idh/MocA family oxidoreductase [Pontibacter sp.]
GAIGEPRFVNIKLYQPLKPELYQGELPWRVKPEISGGGLFHDLAPHQLDILDFLLGPITAASGQVANQGCMYEAEDLVTAQFKFESGALGSGVWCFSIAEEQQQDSIEIVGSAGSVVFPTFAQQNPVRLETAAGVEKFLLPPPAHVQQPFIQAIVDELTGKGQCPGSAVSAVRTAWVMDQIVGRG